MKRMATKKTIRYSEPEGFFPKTVRKAAKIGEYANESKEKKTVKRTKKK